MIKSKGSKTSANATKAAKTKGAALTKLGLMQEMLLRPEGVTIAQLAKALEWQPHSVRGAIAGSLKKQGIKIVTSKVEGEDRIYRIEG